MAGYSATPLWKKLGYRNGDHALLLGEPGDYLQLLELPNEIKVIWVKSLESGLNLLHAFVTEPTSLARLLKASRPKMAQDGMLWISWPKQSSGMTSPITEDTIRALCLPLGLVDIKVCAVDATWSALKLVIRQSERRR